MNAHPHLFVDRIAKRYADVAALEEVSLSVPEGSYVVLLGPSGSGKTTLLSVIGGFTVPTSGRIEIAGRDVTALGPAARPTTTVFQDYALFPHMSVADNVAFGLRVRGVGRADRAKRVAAALEMVGLGNHGARSVQALSGGQRQRVALARALVVEPEILLLDEPLGALDLNMRRQMQDELIALQKRTGRSFVHVTHDQEEAMALASLIVVMNRGRIEDAGPAARVYARPATRFTAAFMGESTEIAGRVVATDSAGGVVLETPLGRLAATGAGTSGSTVTAIVRPENVRADGGGAVALGGARISEAVFQGAHFRVTAVSEASGQAILLRMPPQMAPEAGSRLELSCRADDLVLVAD